MENIKQYVISILTSLHKTQNNYLYFSNQHTDKSCAVIIFYFRRQLRMHVTQKMSSNYIPKMP